MTESLTLMFSCSVLYYILYTYIYKTLINKYNKNLFFHVIFLSKSGVEIGF